jgi:hypothetical protein
VRNDTYRQSTIITRKILNLLVIKENYIKIRSHLPVRWQASLKTEPESRIVKWALFL